MPIIQINNQDELIEIAKKLLTSTTKKVWLFNGEMGAGKTTLIKAFCKVLKVDSTISSPSFSIVNEYHTIDNNKVYHFDLFRLKNKKELYEIGFEEYIYSGNYCFIEWPKIAEDIIDCDKVEIKIKIYDGYRELNYNY